MSTLKMGVVGSGFVGSSVINGFNTETVEMWVVDPKHTQTTMKEMVQAQPHLVFICVPTPEGKDGEVNVAIADSVLQQLDEMSYSGIVVIKSTITPDHLTGFKKKYKLKLVYNPEFLTEANAHEDFINPQMQILGGKWRDCEWVEKAYVRHSKVKIVPTFKTDLISASLLKYTINSYLATKVTFMNELHELHKQCGAGSTWEQFTDMLQRDSRIGISHMRVPGPDGKFGFGGHCFPKDTAGLLDFADKHAVNLSILKQAVHKNKKHRKK
jgi:UDPglucose 6-dehydrogenase